MIFRNRTRHWLAPALAYSITISVHSGNTISDRIIRDTATGKAWRAGVPVVWLATLGAVSRMTVYRRVDRTIKKAEVSHRPAHGGVTLR